MRFQLAILPLLAALTTALAAPSPPAAPSAPAAKSVAPPGPRQAALDRLLAERASLTALDQAIAAARHNGVSEQAILEARFLYHVDHREDAALVAMLPDLLKQRELFQLENSAVFAMTEDWLAVVEYVRALAALAQADQPAFKQHITEAFWLSPRQAAAFAPHIERSRLLESMRAVKLDFTTKLVPLAGGDPVALEQLIAGKQALLLHFWSPQSRECEAALPDFAATAAALVAGNIAVVSLLPAEPAAMLIDGRTMLRSLGGQPPGGWFLDASVQPLARLLRIQNLPTMVLVSPTGGILFNGDPIEDEFWQALRRIDARIPRPRAAAPPARP